MLPPTFSAALSWQLVHAAWLLSLVQHAGSSHLAPDGTTVLATLLGASNVSNGNTHALHKARSCTYLQMQTSMLLSLLTNRTLLQSPSKTMKRERGCSILLFSILDSCCTALTTTVATGRACLCYVMQPNSATCRSASFILSLRRRRRECMCVCVCWCFF